jgi:hypothetical protein
VEGVYAATYMIQRVSLSVVVVTTVFVIVAAGGVTVKVDVTRVGLEQKVLKAMVL